MKTHEQSSADRSSPTVPAIELQGLTRYFGAKPVVRDLDFRVPEGQVTALLGLNGAGKTTTIRILMGLLAPTRGKAITLGEDASRMSVSTRARIGYLVEGHFLYPSMRVRQCQDFQRAGYATWNDELFRDIVRHFGIDQDARVSTLSRGQRAGVSLALVLAPDPELLVLDDPALGLDPVSRRALNETLIEFAGGGKRTVILSTHLLDDVERIADRVAVMVGGRLKVDTMIDDFTDRVSLFAVHGDEFDASVVAAIPGLIEARKLGDRLQIAVADADEETLAAIDRLSGQPPERVDSTLGDAVLAYLTRERGDGSFFSTPVTSSGHRKNGAQR
ncbi:ABC transporter ATP-binding protein [Rubripirellula amarantea]|nr:ABC transporter ATP-binding protein [Rubripirellula amarantea]